MSVRLVYTRHIGSEMAPANGLERKDKVDDN